MAKFVFQLEAVLRQRKQVERQRQRALAQVMAALNALEAELRELDDSVRHSNANMRANHLVGTLDLSYLAAHRRFMLASQRKALTLMQRMTLAQRQVEEARRQLADAARHRKVIEKLKERHHERWMQTLSRRELSEMDEIAMQLSFWHSSDDTAGDDPSDAAIHHQEVHH